VSRREAQVSSFSRSDDSSQLRQRWLLKQTPQPNEKATPAREAHIERKAVAPVMISEAPSTPQATTKGVGIPTLVIKGNTKPDPAREDAKLQYIISERAREAYIRAEQQRAWEEEQSRLEQQAYEQYMRDLQVQEQELRVEGLAEENNYRESLRVPYFGYLVGSPWRRVRLPHRGDGHDRDSDRRDGRRDAPGTDLEGDPAADAGDTGTGTTRVRTRTKPESTTPSATLLRRTIPGSQEPDSATAPTP
jgi:hypothetical protein